MQRLQSLKSLGNPDSIQFLFPPHILLDGAVQFTVQHHKTHDGVPANNFARVPRTRRSFCWGQDSHLRYNRIMDDYTLGACATQYVKER